MSAVDWTSLVSGGAIAGAGGLIGAWAVSRRERSVQLRERMLDAADWYVATLRRMLDCLRFFGEEPQLEEASGLHRELEVLVARIELLFGPMSPAAGEAGDASLGAERALDYVRRSSASSAQDDRLDDEQLERLIYPVEGRLHAFQQIATVVIRSGGHSPPRQRVGIRWLFRHPRIRWVFRHPRAYWRRRWHRRQSMAGAEHVRALEARYEEARAELRASVSDAEALGIEMPADLLDDRPVTQRTDEDE